MEKSAPLTSVTPVSITVSEKSLPGEFSWKTSFQRSFSHAVGEFASRTGMHAVSDIAAEDRRSWRTTWCVLLVLAGSILLWQVGSLSYKLWLRPTATTIDVQLTNPIPFPAVTFCNLNPMQYFALMNFNTHGNADDGTTLRKRSAADETMEETMETLKEMFVYDNYTSPSTENNEDSATRDKEETMPLNQRVMFLMNSLSPAMLSGLTYSLSQLLVECRFDGRNCVPEKDFVKIISPRFGNCFVFNSGSSPENRSQPVELKSISRSGSQHGLEMTLLIDQDNYLPDFAPAAGIKLIIHSPKYPPIPEDEGLVLAPGFFTNLGIKLTRIRRAEPPYGRCKYFTKAENRTRNMYLDQLPMTSPGEDVCTRTCEQLQVMLNCGCYSLALGYADSDAFKTVPSAARRNPCGDTDGDGSMACEERILWEVAAGQHGCRTKTCKYQECVVDRYEASLSAASWPDKKSWMKITSKWNLPNDTARRVLGSEAKIRENFVKILIAYDDLNVISYTTRPMYEIIDFLSNLGGQGGLWLGISVFTVCEVLILLVRLGYILSANCCYGNKE